MDWFLGLFGASSGSCNEGNCQLREHLRKCAGLGKRPPPVDCDQVNACMRKNDPNKKKEEEEVKDPCPAERIMPPIFIPKCSVPATTTFRCTDWPCEDCEKKK